MKSRVSRLPIAWLVPLLAAVVGTTAPAADGPLELRPIFREDAVISVTHWAAFKPTVKSRLTGREIVPGIDVFEDGRCLIRTFEGWEFQKINSAPNKVAAMVANFEELGLFAISDESIQRSFAERDKPTKTLLPDGTSVISLPPIRQVYTDCGLTELVVRRGTNHFRLTRDALYAQANDYPEIRELSVLTNCIHQVYEAANEPDPEMPFAIKSLHQRFSDGPDERLLELVKSKPSLVADKDEMECTALHYAARYGRVETARWLIAHKAEVNTTSYNRFTPMHVVTDAAVAKLLIQAGADLAAKDSWNKTPLANASQAGHTNVCEVILESGFPIDLASAIRLGKRDLARKMVREKPDIVKTGDWSFDLGGSTSPLGVAASLGDREMVELLLKAGAPVNAGTQMPNAGFAPATPLCNAVWVGHYEIAAMLCEAGADCNVTGGKFYRRLLDYALQHSDAKMVELLKKHGAKATKEDKP